VAPSWFPPLLHVVPHVSLDAAGRAMGTSGTGGNEAETEHVAADVWLTCGIAGENFSQSTSVAHLKRFFSTTKHTNKSFLNKYHTKRYGTR
jgi:hypothetical protein